MRLHKRSLLRAFAAGIALCVAFGTAACSGGSTSQENDASADSETPTEQITPIEVVASVNQWGSLAEQIGGVHVKVTSVLSSTDVNAHDFEPKTDDIDKLQQAQVVVSNGAGYDTWATKNLSKTMVSVSAAQMVAPSRETIRIYGSPVTPETPWPRNWPTHIAASCPRKRNISTTNSPRGTGGRRK